MFNNQKLTDILLIIAAVLVIFDMSLFVIYRIVDQNSPNKNDSIVQIEETTEPKETTQTEPSKTIDISEPSEETEPLTEPIDYSAYFTDDDIRLVASVIYGEARGIKSEMERAAIAWTVLNRVDAWEQSIKTVVTTPYQFCDVMANDKDFDLAMILAEDVMKRWAGEKNGVEDVGRVLPKDYLYFYGPYGILTNAFRKEYGSKNTWDWQLSNPYSS